MENWEDNFPQIWNGQGEIQTLVFFAPRSIFLTCIDFLPDFWPIASSGSSGICILSGFRPPASPGLLVLGSSTYLQPSFKLTHTLVQTLDSSWGTVLGLDILSPPSDLWLHSVDLCMNTSEQRTEPQRGELTSPQFSGEFSSSHWVSLCELYALSLFPPPAGPGLMAVMRLLSDLIYFFFMLNTIIHSHNGMPSALIVIIRLFYTLTALDMKRNCWIPGYVFHYLTLFSFPTCPCGIWCTLSSQWYKMLLLLESGQLGRNEQNINLVPLRSKRLQLSPWLDFPGSPSTTSHLGWSDLWI